jgi:DNA oxidative demethylase
VNQKSDLLTIDLFEEFIDINPRRIQISEDAFILRGYAIEMAANLIQALDSIIDAAPLRQMYTPGGQKMSVRTTSCGALGWVSDTRGYRYERHDPLSKQPWPPMPASFLQLAKMAAQDAVFDQFTPDSCLINSYKPAAKLSLHQDKDELDFSAPIVSVSLGLPAIFLFGGNTRSTKPKRHRLEHGDVVVWGKTSRLAFHGVEPLIDSFHPQTGRQRINLTFRKVL